MDYNKVQWYKLRGKKIKYNKKNRQQRSQLASQSAVKRYCGKEQKSVNLPNRTHRGLNPQQSLKIQIIQCHM